VMAGQRTTHNRARRRLSRIGLYIFLTVLAFIFLWPMLYALYTSLRPYGELVANANGAFSLPSVEPEQLLRGLEQLELVQYFWNTGVITIPAVLLTLWISSMLAFAISRYKLAFQPHCPDDSSRPATCCRPGHHRAALPAVPAHPSAGSAQRQRAHVDQFIGLI